MLRSYFTWMQSHKSLLNPTDLVSYIPQHTLHHLIIVINPVVVALPNAANPLTTCSFLQCDKKRKPNPLAATSTSSGIFRPQLLSTIQSVFFSLCNSFFVFIRSFCCHCCAHRNGLLIWSDSGCHWIALYNHLVRVYSIIESRELINGL